MDFRISRHTNLIIWINTRLVTGPRPPSSSQPNPAFNLMFLCFGFWCFSVLVFWCEWNIGEATRSDPPHYPQWYNVITITALFIRICSIWLHRSTDDRQKHKIDQLQNYKVTFSIDKNMISGLILYPYTTERRAVLRNTSPEAPEISQGRGFCTPRPERFLRAETHQ